VTLCKGSALEAVTTVFPPASASRGLGRQIGVRSPCLVICIVDLLFMNHECFVLSSLGVLDLVRSHIIASIQNAESRPLCNWRRNRCHQNWLHSGRTYTPRAAFRQLTIRRWALEALWPGELEYLCQQLSPKGQMRTPKRGQQRRAC
jgi:hypothetical protein